MVESMNEDFNVEEKQETEPGLGQTNLEGKVRISEAVSYTHLDVYKRQILNDPTKNIITLEDPVEFTIAGLTQIQINERIGLTFGTVSYTHLNASLKGVAFADEEVLEFGDGLLKASSVGSVSLPVICLLYTSCLVTSFTLVWIKI